MVLSSTRIVWRGAQLDAAVFGGAARGLNLAALHLQALATPLTPYLDGTLQLGYGIHDVFADRESLEQGSQLQNSARYAAYHHEGGDATRHINEANRARNVHPDAQSKFVEQPMSDNRDDLFGIIANAIAAGLS